MTTVNSIHLAILNALKRKEHRKPVNDYIYGKGEASVKIVKHLEKIKIDKELIQKQIFY